MFSACPANRVVSAKALERPGLGALSTGLDVLDAVLPGGGIMRGALSEISGGRSSGKRSLAVALCARVTAQREHAVWIDGTGGFCPLISLEHGVSLERLIVVRVPLHDHGPERRGGSGTRRSRGRRRRECSPALRAADILLSAGDALALLVVDLPPGTRVQPRLLSRLRLGAETSGVALVFVTELPRMMKQHPAGQSLGTFISLWLHAHRVGQGASSGARLGSDVGWQLAVSVAKSKRGKMAHHAVVTIDEPHCVCLDTTV